jgi:DNA-binding HxlR family transcriptional regulator
LSWRDRDRPAELEDLSVRRPPILTRHLDAVSADEDGVGLVHGVEDIDASSVESGGENERMFTGIGRQRHTVHMLHVDSEPGGDAGHQTETFDDELVPDARGRTSRPEPTCPVEVALAAISGRWMTLVLRELMAGPLSFTELRASLPDLSAKVLTERLGDLTSKGLAVREEHPGFPSRTTYQLTPAGLALRPLLVELYRSGSALLALT